MTKLSKSINPHINIQFATTNVAWAYGQIINAILKVFNDLGEEVAELLNKKMKTGVYYIMFGGDDINGRVYLYQLRK